MIENKYYIAIKIDKFKAQKRNKCSLIQLTLTKDCSAYILVINNPKGQGTKNETTYKLASYLAFLVLPDVQSNSLKN